MTEAIQMTELIVNEYIIKMNTPAKFNYAGSFVLIIHFSIMIFHMFSRKYFRMALYV